MEASLRCWFCDVTAFTQSLIRACVICLSRSLGESPAGRPGRPSGIGVRVSRAGREKSAHAGALF